MFWSSDNCSEESEQTITQLSDTITIHELMIPFIVLPVHFSHGPEVFSR